VKLISYRKGFWANSVLAERDEIRNVPLVGNGVEVPMTEVELASKIDGRRILLLIHGYNNERDEIRGAYERIAREMDARGLVGDNAAYHEILGIVWPGGKLGVSYAPAKLRANAMSDAFFARLRWMTARAAAVDINTHSLGARVALKALQNATPDEPIGSTPNAIKIRNLWLTGPALDDESIERGYKFFAATRAVERVHVIHSREDEVLRYLFPFGDGGRALGYQGPFRPQRIADHSPNVRIVDGSQVVGDHSAYRKSPEIFSYFARALGGQHYPQFSTLQPGS